MDFVTVTLLSLIFLGVLVWKLMQQDSSGNNLPPGPRKWPLVGNIPELIAGFKGGKCDKFLKDLNEKYGPIMTLNVGLGKLRILIFDADLMKEAFIENARITSSRPNDYYFVNEIMENKGILFNPSWEGPRTYLSKAVTGCILGPSSLDKMVQDEAMALCVEFRKKEGRTFDPFHLVHFCLLNIISSLLFSKRCKYNDSYYENIVTNMTYFFRKNIFVHPINTFPHLRYLKYFSKIFDTGKVQRAYDVIKNHVRREIKERLETFDQSNITDLLDLYLSKEKTEFMDIDKENLLLILSEMYLGGSYTNGVAIRWIILIMINYPAVQEKCRKEIHKVLGDTGIPELKHMRDLIYVQATIYECLRLKNVGSSNLPHSVDENMKLGGYDIPKGASIMAILMIPHLDKNAFGEDAEHFRPERWIDDNGKLKKFKEFMPFGLGKRQCLGKPLAEKELFIITVSLLQQFKLKPADPENPPKIEGYFGFFQDPHRYNIVAEPCIEQSG